MIQAEGRTTMAEQRTARGLEAAAEDEPPYKIISGPQSSIQKNLDELAAKAYRPILMSSCPSPNSPTIETTVILERWKGR
jgi:hypothetical protein